MSSKHAYPNAFIREDDNGTVGHGPPECTHLANWRRSMTVDNNMSNTSFNGFSSEVRMSSRVTRKSGLLDNSLNRLEALAETNGHGPVTK